MIICHFGGFDAGYARNLVFRKSLELLGHEVRDCTSMHPNAVLRQFATLWKAARHWRDIDVIVVGTVAHYSMPFAFALATALRKPLVFDIFDSRWEAMVLDAGLAETSLQAEYYRQLDRSVCTLAELVVVDTALHAEFFTTRLGVPADKMRYVPVGVDETRFNRDVEPHYPNGERDRFRVGFVGSFYKSHGLDVVMRAARIIEDCAPQVVFDLYGDGAVRVEMESLAQQLGVSNVHFYGRVPYDRVPSLVAGFDVVLGLFAETGKPLNVAPNKAYEAAAMRKPLVTGDTPAMRAMFEHGSDCVLVRLGDAEALAESILELERNTASRDRLAAKLYDRFQAEYSLAVLGRRWDDIIAEATELHRERRR